MVVFHELETELLAQLVSRFQWLEKDGITIAHMQCLSPSHALSAMSICTFRIWNHVLLLRMNYEARIFKVFEDKSCEVKKNNAVFRDACCSMRKGLVLYALRVCTYVPSLVVDGMKEKRRRPKVEAIN